VAGPTRLRRARGQALVEFALVLPLMMTIVISVLNFMPAVTTRGVVLDVSETSLEIAARFIPAVTATAAQDRTVLCNQLLDVVRSELSAALTDNLPSAFKPTKSPVTSGANGCAPDSDFSGNNPNTGRLTPPAGGANPVVYVSALNGGNVSEGTRLLPTVYVSGVLQPLTIKVCISYTWYPNGGIEYLVIHNTSDLSRQVLNTFTYRFCGNDVINPNRAR